MPSRRYQDPQVLSAQPTPQPKGQLLSGPQDSESDHNSCTESQARVWHHPGHHSQKEGKMADVVY